MDYQNWYIYIPGRCSNCNAQLEAKIASQQKPGETMQNPVREVAFGGQAFPLRHRSFHHLLKGWSFRNRTNSWPSNLKKKHHRASPNSELLSVETLCTRLLGKKWETSKQGYEWNMECFRGVSGKRHDLWSQEMCIEIFRARKAKPSQAEFWWS